MKVIWQDIYTLTDTNFEEVKKSFGKCGMSESYGKVVYEDKERVVLLQNTIKCVDDGDDYIIIPKSVIRRRF